MFYRSKIRKISLRALAGILSTVVFLPATAWSCNLKTLETETKPVAIELYGDVQNFAVSQNYTFRKNGNNYDLYEVTTIHISDLKKLFRDFVDLKTVPKSECDYVQPTGIDIGIDQNTSMAYGYFNTHFIDYRCFPLRFFQPEPGVEKEPLSYKVKEGEVFTKIALRPSVQNGTFKVEVAVIHEGPYKENLLKLFKYKLDGFLDNPLFTSMVETIVSGLGEDIEQGFTARKAGFITDESGIPAIIIASNKTVNETEACTFFNNKVKSSSWEITE